MLVDLWSKWRRRNLNTRWVRWGRCQKKRLCIWKYELGKRRVRLRAASGIHQVTGRSSDGYCATFVVWIQAPWFKRWCRRQRPSKHLVMLWYWPTAGSPALDTYYQMLTEALTMHIKPNQHWLTKLTDCLDRVYHPVSTLVAIWYTHVKDLR